MSIAEDNKVIEAPPDEDNDDDDEGSGSVGEAKKILDHLNLPNYDDVQMRLDEPEIQLLSKEIISLKSSKTQKRDAGGRLLSNLMLLKSLKRVSSLQRKEIEYMEIQISSD